MVRGFWDALYKLEHLLWHCYAGCLWASSAASTAGDPGEFYLPLQHQLSLPPETYDEKQYPQILERNLTIPDYFEEWNVNQMNI